MKIFSILIVFISIISCKQSVHNKLPHAENITKNEPSKDFTIVFASCNDQNRAQPLWEPILMNSPDLFIWGGDNIYSDTDDMSKMKKDYDKLITNTYYKELSHTIPVIGTWDDHDYGKNDAGVEWEKKKESQQLFLDFLRIPKDDSLRFQEGVYYSRKYTTPVGSLKVISLDTRYFRDPLKRSKTKGWRYDAWEEQDGMTILGDVQWKWLEGELEDDSAMFTIIISSIQFLNDEHGYEKWGNFPSEVKKMYTLLKKAKAKNIMILSGDRHFAEFSSVEVDGLPYKLIDFTSSGLTHTYPDSPPSPNRFRVGKEIKDLNFGVLRFDFTHKKVFMEIRGKNNLLLEELELQY